MMQLLLKHSVLIPVYAELHRGAALHLFALHTSMD